MRGGSERFRIIDFDSRFYSTFQPILIFLVITDLNPGTHLAVMVDRELDYIDFRDFDARRQYVDEAPSPVSGTPTHLAAPADVFATPPPRPRGRPRKSPEPLPASQGGAMSASHPAAQEPPRGIPGARRRRHAACLVRGQSRHHSLRRRRPPRQVAAPIASRRRATKTGRAASSRSGISSGSRSSSTRPSRCTLCGGAWRRPARRSRRSWSTAGRSCGGR